MALARQADSLFLRSSSRAARERNWTLPGGLGRPLRLRSARESEAAAAQAWESRAAAAPAAACGGARGLGDADVTAVGRACGQGRGAVEPLRCPFLSPVIHPKAREEEEGLCSRLSRPPTSSSARRTGRNGGGSSCRPCVRSVPPGGGVLSCGRALSHAVLQGGELQSKPPRAPPPLPGVSRTAGILPLVSPQSALAPSSPSPFGVLQFTSREGSLPSLREPPPSGHAPSHLSIKLPCLSPMLSVAPQAPGDLASELSFSATDFSQRIALQVSCSASNLCRANGLRGFWVGLCLSSTYLTRFL